MNCKDTVLIVGELVIDYTLAQRGVMCKLRLGGIAHAARGMWAAGLKYSVAAFCHRCSERYPYWRRDRSFASRLRRPNERY